jgi:hypothetical protein
MIAILGTIVGIFGSGPGGFGVPQDVLFHKVYKQMASGMGKLSQPNRSYPRGSEEACTPVVVHALTLLFL